MTKICLHCKTSWFRAFFDVIPLIVIWKWFFFIPKLLLKMVSWLLNVNNWKHFECSEKKGCPFTINMIGFGQWKVGILSDYHYRKLLFVILATIGPKVNSIFLDFLHNLELIFCSRNSCLHWDEFRLDKLAHSYIFHSKIYTLCKAPDEFL